MSDFVRPFVSAPIGDRDTATLASEMARSLGEHPVEHHRTSMNAIYYCGDSVIRIGRTTGPPTAALELAEVLHAAGVAVARPRLDTCRSHDDLSATVWERLRPSPEPVDWHGIGEMIAILHDLEPHRIPVDYPLSTPSAFEWWNIDERLEGIADRIDETAYTSLLDTIEQTRCWRDQLQCAAVVCHGDLHPGNVMQTVNGPVILDWDLLCLAPAGWDLAPLRYWGSVWAGDASILHDFTAGYGHGLDDDLFTALVAQLRLAVATVMLLLSGDTTGEAERRLRYWRGEVDPPRWRAR